MVYPPTKHAAALLFYSKRGTEHVIATLPFRRFLIQGSGVVLWTRHPTLIAPDCTHEDGNGYPADYLEVMRMSHVLPAHYHLVLMPHGPTFFTAQEGVAGTVRTVRTLGLCQEPTHSVQSLRARFSRWCVPPCVLQAMLLAEGIATTAQCLSHGFLPRRSPTLEHTVTGWRPRLLHLRKWAVCGHLVGRRWWGKSHACAPAHWPEGAQSFTKATPGAVATT